MIFLHTFFFIFAYIKILVRVHPCGLLLLFKPMLWLFNSVIRRFMCISSKVQLLFAVEEGTLSGTPVSWSMGWVVSGFSAKKYIVTPRDAEWKLLVWKVCHPAMSIISMSTLLFLKQDLSCHAYSIDPGQMASEGAPDLDLHCLLFTLWFCSKFASGILIDLQ